jgi:short-subunit dehydrogenase
MEKRSADKVVVITGASSGAGRAMAIELAKEGADLILAARRQEALEEVVKECIDLGASALALRTDTRDANALQHLAKSVVELRGRIDVWINNAGVLAVGELDQIPAEVNEAVIRTNLLGYIHGAHAVLPIFKEQGFGILINNISVGGWFATPYMSAYSASKFGLQGFSESLKGELKDFPDIHVCDLYPAFLDTPGVQHAANYTGKHLTPAPPVYDPREVARAVVRLTERPVSRTAVGVFPHLLRIAFRTLPSLTRNTTASLIKNYLQKADATENTSGNVLSTVQYGTGIDGGWRKTSLKPAPKNGWLLFAGAVIGLMLFNKR